MEAVEQIVAWFTVEGVRARMLPAHRHPPMERTPAVATLVTEAQAVAREFGLEAGEAATGGAADEPANRRVAVAFDELAMAI